MTKAHRQSTRRAIRGGYARAAALTATQRSAIARTAAQIRWGQERIPKRLTLPECGAVRFVDLGAEVRVELLDGRPWSIWNEAQVDGAITLLREWRRKQREERRRGDRLAHRHEARDSNTREYSRKDGKYHE